MGEEVSAAAKSGAGAKAGGASATADTGGGSGASPWLAFSACGAIWGSTFLVISIGNDLLAPVWAAALRLMLAALILTAWTLLRGAALPKGDALRAASLYGLCAFGINLPLLYWSEKLIPSGLAAVFYATIPLSSAIITRAMGVEKLNAFKIVGALTAFAGVALLFSSSFSHAASPAGMIAVFSAATIAGMGTILLRRGPRQDPIAANAVACAIGGVMSLAASFALREAHVLPTTMPTVLPLLYLTIAGSVGAFVIMSWLVNHWEATRVSYISVIVPVIALILGAIVRHEHVGLLSLAASALVLTGLLIGMRGSSGGH
jgi:drug/metabolite transporter (DMT)-like permease